MSPPFLSYVTWNRMGLTVKNILRILQSRDDFEMHIIDSNSLDDTWCFIKEIEDSRIKSRTRLDKNHGPVYAYNLNLSKRKKDQFFIHVDNDVYFHTLDWISKLTEAFDEFTELGMLGIPRPYPYPQFLPPVEPRIRKGICYLKLLNAKVNGQLDFIPRCCIMFRPELFNYIGYWSEETQFTDAEMSPRVVNYTPYTAGFATNIWIEQPQNISCDICPGKSWCSIREHGIDCNKIWSKYYLNSEFVKSNLWKNLRFFNELQEDRRSVFCGSIHNKDSLSLMKPSTYHFDWVEDNFNTYVKHANQDYKDDFLINTGEKG